MARAFVLLLLTLIVCGSVFSTPISGDTGAFVFHVYASQSCKVCQDQVKLLEDLYGNDSVTLHDILDDGDGQYYRGILDLLVDKEIIGSSDPIRGVIPLSSLFENNNLRAIVFGSISQEYWQRIVTDTSNVSIYFHDESRSNETILEESTVETLSGYFKQEIPVDPNPGTEDLVTLLNLVSLLAIADAINPCELNAFLLLIVYIFYNIGKKAVLKIGLAFTTAVFITYYIMGLGLLRIFQGIPHLKLVIGAFGLVVGTLEIMTFFGLNKKHIPDTFATKVKESLERTVNPFTAFFAGIVVSLLLLPCTSGPYFITLELMSQNTNFMQGLFLLTIYNAIVAAPFLALTILISVFKFKTFKLRSWMNKRENWIRLFAGTCMIAISLILLITQ